MKPTISAARQLFQIWKVGDGGATGRVRSIVLGVTTINRQRNPGGSDQCLGPKMIQKVGNYFRGEQIHHTPWYPEFIWFRVIIVGISWGHDPKCWKLRLGNGFLVDLFSLGCHTCKGCLVWWGEWIHQLYINRNDHQVSSWSEVHMIC